MSEVSYFLFLISLSLALITNDMSKGSRESQGSRMSVAPQNNNGDFSTTTKSDGIYPIEGDYPYSVSYNRAHSGSVYDVLPHCYSSAPPTPEYPSPHLVTPTYYAPHPDAGSSYSQHFVPQLYHEQHHQFHHPSSQHHHVQQIYYGPPAPWPAVVSSIQTALTGHQQQQLAGHYNQLPPPIYPTSVPLSMSSMSADVPRRGSGGSRRSSSKSNNDQQQHYGSLELNAFDVENYSQLVSALNLVKRNTKATLFDVDESLIADLACFDETSSRFIQKRLRLGTDEERSLALATALSSFDRLWRDQNGNFLIQGLFDFGSTAEKKELMEAIYDQDVVTLCLHMHGCRIIQKAVQRIDQRDVCKLVSEFLEKVLLFIHDPNGNHVIQRCIQVMSAFPEPSADDCDADFDSASSLTDQMQVIVDDIVANIELLSTHRYGCRVVQRAIEHCDASQKTAVLEHIVSCLESLIVDHYGNYVVQQVFVCGDEAHKAAILDTLTRDDSLLKFSKHKYASNVVETVLMHGQPHHKERILQEILKDTRGEDGGYCCVIELSKNSIANYVVNRAIEACEKDQQRKFIDVISSNRAELVKSPYAKYVLQRIDKASSVLNQEEIVQE